MISLDHNDLKAMNGLQSYKLDKEEIFHFLDSHEKTAEMIKHFSVLYSK